MEIKSNEQVEKVGKYIRAPIKIEVPCMDDLQSRKNPFSRPARPDTLNPRRTGSLVNCKKEDKVHAKTFVRPGSPSCPVTANERRHDTLTSEVSESISENDYEWVLDERIEDSIAESYEELKIEEYGRYELTREIQRNFTIMRLLNKATLEEIKAREVELEPVEKRSNKTLALDLDETLIHMVNPKFEYSSMSMSYGSAQSVLYKDPETLTFNSIKVIIRPHAVRLLKELSEIYEIVVSLAEYSSRYSQQDRSVTLTQSSSFSTQTANSSCSASIETPASAKTAVTSKTSTSSKTEV